MSNRASIDATEFHDAFDHHVTYGFRIYDNEGGDYCNNWNNIPDTRMGVLKKVLSEYAMSEYSENTNEILSFVKEMHNGIYISDTWFEWDEIKHLFDDTEDDQEAIDAEQVFEFENH